MLKLGNSKDYFTKEDISDFNLVNEINYLLGACKVLMGWLLAFGDWRLARVNYELGIMSYELAVGSCDPSF